VLVVAGLSLKNLEPRVWDPTSEFYVPTLKAVMVSYAEFHQMPARRKAAMDVGLRSFLAVPEGIPIYLDNGAFYFGGRDGPAPLADFEEFANRAQPDWKPIPQDYIPLPSMSAQQRRGCFDKTMRVNRAYSGDGYVPVVHIGSHLPQYVECVQADARLATKKRIALGALVPNLLRKEKALPYGEILRGLLQVRAAFKDKSIHVFGVGGTATLHLTALTGFDSTDSSGWRNRAARGIVQLPGGGDRMVADLGKWRGRRPSPAEWDVLRNCPCPACAAHGTKGLKAGKLLGFCCRATHNLWVLLGENAWLEEQIRARTYAECYAARVNNSIYRPLIEELLALLGEGAGTRC
jgi:hypothetical protein